MAAGSSKTTSGSVRYYDTLALNNNKIIIIMTWKFMEPHDIFQPRWIPTPQHWELSPFFPGICFFLFPLLYSSYLVWLLFVFLNFFLFLSSSLFLLVSYLFPKLFLLFFFLLWFLYSFLTFFHIIFYFLCFIIIIIIIISSSSSSILIIICINSDLACYRPLAFGTHLSKGIELNKFLLPLFIPNFLNSFPVSHSKTIWKWCG
jgi:hypothetical protein